MVADDFKHAIRRLRAQPGTAAVACGMLAVAIGVASAMFTIADHLLIRPVPYADPATLVNPYLGTGPQNMMPYVSPAIARAWRASPAFSSVQVVVSAGATVLDGPAGPVSVGARWITPGTFGMIGVLPSLGRTFAPGEGRPGTEDRIIISDRVWQQQFGRDPQVIGRRVRVSGTLTTIVGVMPARFHFPYWNIDLWQPYDLDAPPALGRRPLLITYARLAARVPAADAAQLSTVAANAVDPLNGRHVILRGVAAGFLDDYSWTAIAVLAGGVALVFLVLCANATSLMLARATARRQEFGVCAALGASRGRLLRQVFLEIVLTATVAAVAGFAIGAALISLAQRFLPPDFLARTLNPVHVDGRAVAGASLIALITAIIAGLPPAWIATAMNPIDSMRGAGRGGTHSRASRGWTRALLVGEVALATMLLAGAGVLLASFTMLMHEESGLDPRGVTTISIMLPPFSFADAEARAAVARDIREQIGALPGVEQAALSLGAPPGYASTQGPLRVDGSAERRVNLQFFQAEPSFFGVYGVAIIAGRAFQASDGLNVAVVSQRFASAFWPGLSPLGHQFSLPGEPPYRVVGVAREVRGNTLLDTFSDEPEFYVPFTPGDTTLSVGLRCAGACPDEAAIRARVRHASGDAVVRMVQPLAEAYREQFDRPRAAAGLAVAFAVVALFAAAGGLFSVLSYAVRTRRREFGIRVAMGAQPEAIRQLVLADGLGVALAGLTLGALGVWLLSRVLAAVAFGVTPHSPLVWAFTAATIAIASLLATWLPASSAMRTSPLVLLRDE